MSNVLLLEDDRVLGESIEELLSESGYRVDWLMHPEEALEYTFHNTYDLYILDINLPMMDGLTLLASLHHAGDWTPTILISARHDLQSISQGFALGAYDYLKKPFYPQELLIRIHHKLHHGEQASRLTYKNITYHIHTHEVYYDQTLLSLGPVQTKLIYLFLTHQGITLSKERCFEEMEYPSDGALRVAINKLKHITHWPIQTVRGVGYRLEKS